MAITGLADHLPVLGPGNVRSAANRFGNYGRYVPLLGEDVFHIPGAHEVTSAATAAFVEAVVLIGRRHVFGAREERADVLAKNRFPTDGDGVQGGAVERVPHGNRLVATGSHPRQFDGHADGTGAAWTQQHLVQVAGRELHKLAGQVDGDLVGVAPGAEGKPFELFLDRRNDRGMAKAHLVDVIAVEVQITPALKVLDIGAITGTHDIETGG